jgi:tRNA-2-methylthio-N6-dimethylallyladenosine synthase
MLAEMGYALRDAPEQADLILFNTCAVRDHAERRALGVIGALKHIKESRPECVIAVCGCMPQREQMANKLRQSYGFVDLVFGTRALWKFPELLESALRREGRVFDTLSGDDAVAEIPALSVRANRVKAWLPVMYGCDNFCSYCIVPHVRGRERSREPADILRDAHSLAETGCKDITLLGQNVNSYGRGLEPDVDFPELLGQIAAVDGDFIIRFMTSHPKDAGEKLFSAMADSGKIARHIHLPFQAGSNSVLRAMNRGYTIEAYMELLRAARRLMPDISITSDVIVGFPGESGEDFRRTLDVVRAVGFDALFTFIYSPREGTPAAAMDDSVPREEKQLWFDELLSVQNAISAQKPASLVGSAARVLVDGRDTRNEGALTARTNGGRLVRVSGADDGDIGQFIDVKITGSTTWSLLGEKHVI